MIILAVFVFFFLASCWRFLKFGFRKSFRRSMTLQFLCHNNECKSLQKKRLTLNENLQHVLTVHKTQMYSNTENLRPHWSIYSQPLIVCSPFLITVVASIMFFIWKALLFGPREVIWEAVKHLSLWRIHIVFLWCFLSCVAWGYYSSQFTVFSWCKL